MSSQQPISTDVEPPRVILVLTVPPDQRELEHEREEEMRSLIKTAGGEVVDVVRQHLRKPIGSTYIGSGKIEEVKLRPHRAG